MAGHDPAVLEKKSDRGEDVLPPLLFLVPSQEHGTMEMELSFFLLTAGNGGSISLILLGFLFFFLSLPGLPPPAEMETGRGSNLGSRALLLFHSVVPAEGNGLGQGNCRPFFLPPPPLLFPVSVLAPAVRPSGWARTPQPVRGFFFPFLSPFPCIFLVAVMAAVYSTNRLSEKIPFFFPFFFFPPGKQATNA